ncbi:hypothetical protein [Paludisphaera soli]|uniref:hypothetical protein n=1 Tax=Paludisphaera soli TaxID=2712865 RepID=UPI0013ECED22|nr:hypothetical protein [Paludisphaera soli]
MRISYRIFALDKHGLPYTAEESRDCEANDGLIESVLNRVLSSRAFEDYEIVPELDRGLDVQGAHAVITAVMAIVKPSGEVEIGSHYQFCEHAIFREPFGDGDRLDLPATTVEVGEVRSDLLAMSHGQIPEAMIFRGPEDDDA